MHKEILPCRSCGGKAVYFPWDNKTGTIRCTECYESFRMRWPKEKAIELWNSGTEDEEADKFVKSLERLLRKKYTSKASDYDGEECIPHYFCGDCIHWKCEKGRQLPCKRIDHDKIRFRKPFFKSYDGNQHGGIVCSDFEPRNRTWWRWRSFWDFWPLYVQEWIPYGKTDILYYFVLNGDESVEYGVPLMDFVSGAMIDGNTLKAVEKMYYSRSKDQNGFGYRLIHEPIDGVLIEEAVKCSNKS